jgi:two-component sensor histidine kinase
MTAAVSLRSLLDYVRLTTKALARIESVLAGVVILAGLALWTWADFEDTRRDAEIKVLAAAIAIEELARHSLLAIDGVLESIVARLEVLAIDSSVPEREKEYLRRIARRLPETGAVFVVDRAGLVVASAPAVQATIHVNDREWFRSLKEENEDLVVGRALKGRTLHNIFFPVARAIRASDETFLGAVQVGIEATYFAHLFRTLNVGTGAHLGFYQATSGAVVARYPMTEALLEETVSTLPYFPELTTLQGQAWNGWVHIAGQEHLVSARRLLGWPLIASASLPKSEIYTGAWTRLWARSLIAATTILALSLLSVLTARQARREATLTSELSHRVKNMLTVIQVVIERAREHSRSVDEFASSLRGRIHSMLDAQNLLAESPKQGVNLADLIKAELRPYTVASNTSVEGPAVYLVPSATHAMAMVIHELATNAAKYGALSCPEGKIGVRWTFRVTTSSQRILEIEWRETGGPTVAAPSREGHGSSVIRELVPYELGGSVSLDFAAEGFRCRMELPATVNTLA